MRRLRGLAILIALSSASAIHADPSEALLSWQQVMYLNPNQQQQYLRDVAKAMRDFEVSTTANFGDTFAYLEDEISPRERFAFQLFGLPMANAKLEETPTAPTTGFPNTLPSNANLIQQGPVTANKPPAATTPVPAAVTTPKPAAAPAPAQPAATDKPASTAGSPNCKGPTGKALGKARSAYRQRDNLCSVAGVISGYPAVKGQSCQTVTKDPRDADGKGKPVCSAANRYDASGKPGTATRYRWTVCNPLFNCKKDGKNAEPFCVEANATAFDNCNAVAEANKGKGFATNKDCIDSQSQGFYSTMMQKMKTMCDTANITKSGQLLECDCEKLTKALTQAGVDLKAYPLAPNATPAAPGGGGARRDE